MQGKLPILAAAGVAAAVVASIASGSDGSRTIAATAVGAGITFVNAHHSGAPSLGDYEIGRTRFVDEGGKAVGRGTVTCTQVNPAGTQYTCSGVNHFTGGDLTTAGIFSPLAKSFSLAITGGTGAYAGARGTLKTIWLTKD